MNFIPTDEQLAVVSALKSRSDSLMVKSYAGCTKTSTLELASPHWRSAALALAFNKKIAVELSARLPDHYTVKTFNSMGYGVTQRSLGRRLILDERKLGKLVTQIAKDREVELTSEQWDCIRRAVSAAMMAGLTPGDEGQPLLPDTSENWLEIGLAAGAPDEEEWEFLADLARHALEADIAAVRRDGVVSFDDQVYYSTCLAPLGAWPKFPLLMVDEAQDLSPLNHQMLARMTLPTTRLVAVGDPLQAIYHFRGADSRSMATLRQFAPEWHDLALTLTFRCPKVVVDRQQNHAVGFRAHEGNAQGEFWSSPAESEWEWSVIPPGPLMVLCRNNAPLLGLAFKLIRRGIGVQMLGRDIHKGLEALTKKLANDDDSGIVNLLARLRDWEVSQLTLAEANGRSDDFLDRIRDQAECLRASAESSEVKTAGQLRLVLRQLFARDSGLVTLSSIHKAKGLECQNVLHLDPGRIPSKFALRQGGAALEQEWNLKYVAETRAKRWLGEARLDDLI